MAKRFITIDLLKHMTQFICKHHPQALQIILHIILFTVHPDSMMEVHLDNKCLNAQLNWFIMRSKNITWHNVRGHHWTGEWKTADASSLHVADTSRNCWHILCDECSWCAWITAFCVHVSTQIATLQRPPTNTPPPPSPNKHAPMTLVHPIQGHVYAVDQQNWRCLLWICTRVWFCCY